MARTLQPESRISHYRIIGPLGAGGMGEVYRAQDETLGRDVALKILPPDLVRNEDRVRRFILEAKSASSLNHPNIVTIYEVGKDVVRGANGEVHPGLGAEPVHFIAMELVSGKTLQDIVHREKSDLRTVLGYLAQVAEGLAKAHAAGIVHRDLKPGNIMVSHDGYAKMLDFGLAKLTERGVEDQEATSAMTSAGELTDGGVVLGTVGYMSPEQVRGTQVDHRSDIFAFGCVLYEVSTGRRPFVTDSHIDTLHAIVHDKPSPIDSYNPAVPAELRRLIRRCMEKNPDQRLQSSKDLAIELREIVDEYDALSASATSGSTIIAPVVRRRRRNLIPLVAVGLGVVGLAALGLWLVSQRSSGGDESTRDDSFQSTRMSILMSPKELQSATLSGDGRYLAYVVGPAGQWSLRVRQVVTGSDVTVLPPQKDPIRGANFSPDGNYLYYLALDPETPLYNALFEIPSLGGTPRKRLFDVDSPVDVSPDGRNVAFIRGMPQEQRSVLLVADLGTGQERILASVSRPDNFPFVTPRWSPDGTKIVAAVNKFEDGTRGTLFSFDANDGGSQPLTDEAFIQINSIGWTQGGSGLVVVGRLRDANLTQIHYIALPEGRLHRITNDLDNWTDLSMTADGTGIAAVRRSRTGNLWLVGVDGKEPARELTTVGGENIGGILTTADGTILFAAQQDQARILFAMRPDGSQRRALTSSAFVVGGQRLLANDAGVVIIARGVEERVPHIQRLNLDGSGLTQLTNESGEELDAVSPDGRTLLFRRSEDQSKLWRMSTDGGQAEILNDDPLFTTIGYSQDGRFMAYSILTEVEGRQRELYKILPAAGGEPVGEILMPGAAAEVTWVPDGSAFSYIVTEDGVSNIWLQPVPSGAPTRLTRFSDGLIGVQEWSRRGKLLFLVRAVADDRSLWVVNRDGSGATRLTDFRGGDFFSFEFSRDERSIAFVHGDERSDVVMIRAATVASASR